jgi:F-box/WD-40 domain protein 7
MGYLDLQGPGLDRHWILMLNFLTDQVVSGSRDATLRMWDIGSGECLHVLVGHVAAVRCVQYDGRLVVSGAYDYMVKVTVH